MQHQQVVNQFVNEGKGGQGSYVRADGNVLMSNFPVRGRWPRALEKYPLAVRLRDGGLLVNGARLPWPAARHQRLLLDMVGNSAKPFGVVPFHSIIAAWTDGETREWGRKTIPVRALQREIAIAVPSGGERWRDVEEKDKYGRIHMHRVHTLGDSVVRVRGRHYLSAVDSTGLGSGMYCLIELHADRPPRTLEEAFTLLKPQAVQDAEARGVEVRRQGEWFAIPTKHLTSELIRDVERGIAVHREHHVFGRDGHHEIEEAVIYRGGARKGEVYARGLLRHTGREHYDLDLGTIRWHQVVHNNQGNAYTLSGSTAQFD